MEASQAYQKAIKQKLEPLFKKIDEEAKEGEFELKIEHHEYGGMNMNEFSEFDRLVTDFRTELEKIYGFEVEDIYSPFTKERTGYRISWRKKE